MLPCKKKRSVEAIDLVLFVPVTNDLVNPVENQPFVYFEKNLNGWQMRTREKEFGRFVEWMKETEQSK